MGIETELSTKNRGQTEESEDCTQTGTVASLTFTYPDTGQ